VHRSIFGGHLTAAPARRLRRPARRGARTLGYLAGSLLALATMCASPGDEAPGRALAGEKAGATADSKAELATLESRCFDLTNGHRKQKGLAKLVRKRDLDEIARDHSRDMARRQALDHAGFDRRKKAVMAALPYQSFGENIFRSTRKPDEIPGKALESWIRSPAHRKHLEGDYRMSGMGAARGGDGRIYLTQLFVKEQGPEFNP
jgi:uncharacterized protein YkwD